MEKQRIIVRGGGDIATGTIYRLWRCGFPLLVLEVEHPMAIRRTVSVCDAIYEGQAKIEGMKCRRVSTLEEAEQVRKEGDVPIAVDPTGAFITAWKPDVVVDAILAKKNLGTNRQMASCTIALGPGFTAGVDVDYVVETMRGHNLGRIYESGTAIPNTGVPGIIGGYAAERVIHSPATGMLRNVHHIGDTVEAGEALAYIETEEGKQVPVPATITGLLRGLIRNEFPVTTGLKIADIDPRKSEYAKCFTISDKARSIGGSVLEAILRES